MVPYLNLISLPQWYLQLFTYTHAKFESGSPSKWPSSMLFNYGYVKVLFHTDTGIGGVKKCGENRAISLYLRLSVVVQLLHDLTAVSEGND